jgi:hypothetical protein
MPTRMMLHGNLGNAKATSSGKYRNESMHLAEQIDLAENLAAIGLKSTVEVMQF